MSIVVRKAGDKYMVEATPPHVSNDWKSDLPMGAESILRKIHDLGANGRDVMDAIAYADSFGEGRI
jgi:hypothetical protein